MHSQIKHFALLSLASSAFAVPFRPTGYPAGSSAPYPQGNGTHHHHHNGTAIFGTGHHKHHKHTSTRYSTESITPTLAVVETIVATIYPTPVNSVSVAAVSAADMSVAAVSEFEGAPTGVCAQRQTITTTATVRVTVTVQAESVQAESVVVTDVSVSASPVSKTKACSKKHKSTSASGASYSLGTSSAAAVSLASPTSSVHVASMSLSSLVEHHHKHSSYSSVIESSSVAPVATSTQAVYSTSSAAVSSVPAVSSAPAVSSPVVQSSTPVASSAAPTSKTLYSSSSTGKRGLAYNDASLTKSFAKNPKISWAYNWGQTSSGLSSDFEYVPMLWGNGAQAVSWAENALTAIESGSTHLLSFNEPDDSQQSNIGPAAAAASYMTLMQPFKASHPDVRLGGPAVTNGGNGMGLDWLSSFISSCKACDVDFYPIHWYDSATNAAYFKSHVEQAHQLTGKPIWITEFGASGTDAQISSFLEDVMAWMDQQDYIERYAYFMVSNGLLVNGNSPSSYGQTYATA